MTLRPVKLPRFVAVGLRVTIGLLFVLMGTWKIGDSEYQMGGRIGELFTFMGTLQPWWALVGWTQIVAGALLAAQRLVTVAALVLFGVAINVAAINLALWPEFGTTMLLTAYALVGLCLLLLHDLDKWQYLFWRRPPTMTPRQPDARQPDAARRQPDGRRAGESGRG